jgi:hypothetical protein
MANGRGISAEQLARDYGVSLNGFAEEIVTLLTALPPEDVSAPVPERCRETCASVWAAMVAALDASSLTTQERQRITPMLRDVVVPYWRQHCAADEDIPGMLDARSVHYLRHRDPASQIKTATHVVGRLLETIGIAAHARAALATTLTAAFAHRMLGDIHRINEVRARFGIDLPVLAALTALAQATMSYEPVLRMLRLA